MRKVVGMLLLAGTLVFAGVDARAEDDPAFITFGAGWFDMNKRDDEAGEFRLEYWSDTKWWVFKPFVGVMATTDAALYGHAGIRLDLYFGERFVLSGSFAPGLYHDGDGKDLGHEVQFRSNVEGAYRFDNRARLGVAFYHLSNASLGDDNPGTEVLSVFYAHPLTELFGDEE